MNWKRFGRLALIGVGVCAALIVIPLLFVVVSDAISGSGEHHTSKMVTASTKLDVKVVTDNPNFYAAAIWLHNPPTDEHCREVAKAVADLEFKGRYGQVQVFDDEWARSMVLPENRGANLSAEDEARFDQHLRMTYVHNAKGYWFDR